MAVYVFIDALFSANSVDLSDHTKSVSITYEAEMLDDTVMGTTGTRSNLPGLKNWTIEATLLQDFAGGSVDATLFGLIGAAAHPLKVRKSKTDAISATNPEYQGNGVLANYTPIGGTVGDLGQTSCTWHPGGGTNATLVRDVTP